MKSLWISAPALNTESGIKTLGLPDFERVTGANLFRVLSAAVLSFSTNVGAFSETAGGRWKGGTGREGIGGPFKVTVGGIGGEGIWSLGRVMLELDDWGGLEEVEAEDGLVLRGEDDFRGMVVKD